MSFALHQRKHIEDELTKVVRQQLRNAAHALTTSTGSQFRSAVHESRKSVKKVRAVAAFLTQAGAKLPRKDRKRLKSAAGATAERLEKTRKSAKKWTSPSIKWSGMIAIVASSYRRSRNAMKRARVTGQSATLHSWRKELKTLWYQLRLARPLMTGVAPLIAELNRLETALGDHHNLVVLGATLRGCRDLRSMRAEMRQIDRLAARMRRPLRRRALALGRRLHARKPDAFARWLRAAFQQARPQQAAA